MSIKLTQAEIDKREDLLSSLFTPNTPISLRDLFAGRTPQLREVLDTVRQLGMHGIIYGDRGVGKTSLANILPAVISINTPTNNYATRVNCDSNDSFGSIWKKIFKEIHLTNNAVGFGRSTERVKGASLSDALPETVGPSDVVDLLKRIPDAVIVVDEFDRLTSRKDTALFADLIKQLSDFEVRVTIILIGVADSIDELIEAHASIERCTNQIKFPPMSSTELKEIIEKRIPKAEMSFDKEVPATIARLSQGYPHYTHLLGLHAGRAALDDGRINIQLSDVREAIKTAVAKTTGSIQTAYQHAIRSSQQGSLHEDVLIACALAKPDQFGFFVPPDVRKPLSDIEGKPYIIPAFAGHLAKFCEEERGGILERKGSLRKWRYRFKNPLMRTYVYLKGIERGRVPSEYSPV